MDLVDTQETFEGIFRRVPTDTYDNVLYWLPPYDVEPPPQHIPSLTMKYEAPTDSYYISSGDRTGMWFKSKDLLRLKFDDMLIGLNSADPDPIDDAALDTFIQGGGA